MCSEVCKEIVTSVNGSTVGSCSGYRLDLHVMVLKLIPHSLILLPFDLTIQIRIIGYTKPTHHSSDTNWTSTLLRITLYCTTR